MSCFRLSLILIGLYVIGTINEPPDWWLRMQLNPTLLQYPNLQDSIRIWAWIAVIVLCFAAAILKDLTRVREFVEERFLSGRKTKGFGKRIKRLRKAAERGNPSAQECFGRCYLNGHGVRQSRALGIRWTLAAAELGHASAQNAIGALYQEDANPRSHVRCASWYQKAAEQGNENAQYQLGRLYATGQGVPQDYAQAAAWYRMAAEQGRSDSQFALGNAYLRGQGVPKTTLRPISGLSWPRRKPVGWATTPRRTQYGIETSRRLT